MMAIGNHSVFSYGVSFVRKKICKLISIHVSLGFLSGFSFIIPLVFFSGCTHMNHNAGQESRQVCVRAIGGIG